MEWVGCRDAVATGRLPARLIGTVRATRISGELGITTLEGWKGPRTTGALKKSTVLASNASRQYRTASPVSCPRRLPERLSSGRHRLDSVRTLCYIPSNMKPLPNNPDLRQLTEVFRAFPAVKAVFLFGSAGTNRMHNESDLDLGVEGNIDQLEECRLEILTELARHGFGRVDLVILRAAPPALAHQIVKDHRVVYRRPGVETATIFSNTVRRYLDFRPFLDYHAKVYKERLLHGQT
mgnify:CR=1 FL=1